MQPVVVRRLAACVERVGAVDRVERRQRPARFDGAVDGALVDDVDVDDHLRIGDGSVGRIPVAARPVGVEVPRHLVVELRRPVAYGRVRLQDHRQPLVVDHDGRERVLGLIPRLRHDRGDPIADEPDTVRLERHPGARHILSGGSGSDSRRRQGSTRTAVASSVR